MASSVPTSLLPGLGSGVPCGGEPFSLPLATVEPRVVPLVSFFGRAQAGPPILYRYCSERFAKRAFRVHGSACFGLMSRVATSVVQVLPILLRGACLAYVPNLQAPVVLHLRPSLSTNLWRPCQPGPISSLHRTGLVSTRIQDRFERGGSLPVGRPPPCNRSPSPGCSWFPW